MGRSSSQFDLSNWTVAQVRPQYSLLKNKSTSQPVRLYNHVSIDQEDFQKEQKDWKLRQNIGPNVIKVLHLQKQSALSNTCSKSVTTKVYTEHIQTKLSSLKRKLLRRQISNILSQSSKGFQQIKKVFGITFRITPDLIGYTDTDDIKVWMNNDLSQNIPVDDFSRSINGQHKMIQSLIETIQQLSDKQESKQILQPIKRMSAPYKFQDLNKLAEVKKQKSRQFNPSLYSLRNNPSFAYKPNINTQNQAAKRQIILNLYKGPGSKK